MGLEPTTSCLQSRCSSQLSYVPEGHHGTASATWAQGEPGHPTHRRGLQPGFPRRECRLRRTRGRVIGPDGAGCGIRRHLSTGAHSVVHRQGPQRSADANVDATAVDHPVQNPGGPGEDGVQDGEERESSRDNLWISSEPLDRLSPRAHAADSPHGTDGTGSAGSGRGHRKVATDRIQRQSRTEVRVRNTTARRGPAGGCESGWQTEGTGPEECRRLRPSAYSGPSRVCGQITPTPRRT